MKRPHLCLLGSLLLGLLVAFAPTAALAKRGSKKKRSVKRYHLTLHNVNTKEKVNNLWVIRTDPKNKNRQWVGKRARKRLTHFLRDWRTGRSKHVPERLLWYLYLIGQRYDAPIEIVSGYRHKERRSSRHKQGRAIDIRIKGVSPKSLWRYCKRFNRVGLGYYPNSGFVHIDVRKESYYWIDDSGPGEKARYRSHVSQGKKAKTRKTRKKGARRVRSGKGRKGKAAAAKAKPAVPKAKSKTATKSPPPPVKAATKEKRAPVAEEDRPSAGPKPATAPKVGSPTKARTVKPPLTRPVRPTGRVKAPKVTAPKVAPPLRSRTSPTPKDAPSAVSKKKTPEKAKASPKKKTPETAKASSKEKSAVRPEDAPPEKKAPGKAKGKR